MVQWVEDAVMILSEAVDASRLNQDQHSPLSVPDAPKGPFLLGL